MRPRNPTPEQYEAMVKTVAKNRVRGGTAIRKVSGSKVSPRQSPSPYKSKLEAAYASKLELEKWAGLIHGWIYEPFSFNLATGKRYRVDFVTWGPAGTECIEVKGRWVKNRRDGMTHLHWAAQRFPFLIWRLVWRTDNGWDGRYITP